MRVAFVPRSAEIQPLFIRLVSFLLLLLLLVLLLLSELVQYQSVS